METRSVFYGRDVTKVNKNVLKTGLLIAEQNPGKVSTMTVLVDCSARNGYTIIEMATISGKETSFSTMPLITPLPVSTPMGSMPDGQHGMDSRQ